MPPSTFSSQSKRSTAREPRPTSTSGGRVPFPISTPHATRQREWSFFLRSPPFWYQPAAIQDPRNLLEPHPFRHQQGPRVSVDVDRSVSRQTATSASSAGVLGPEPVFVPDELFLAWLRRTSLPYLTSFRLQHPGPPSLNDLCPWIAPFREHVVPYIPVFQVPAAFPAAFSVADCAHHLLVLLMCLSLWEMDVFGEPGSVVVIFWNKAAAGWEFKRDGHERRRWREELSDVLDSIRMATRNTEDPSDVIRELFRLFHLLIFISRHGGNVSVSKLYLRALRHFVRKLYDDSDEAAREEWIRTHFVDERDLFDGEFLYPGAPPCALASLRTHTEDWDPRLTGVAERRHNGHPILEYRFEGWHQLFFWLAAIAETGFVHPFDPNAFDPESNEWPFESSASIAEGAALGVFLQEYASSLPPGSYSPEDRFLFHGFPPPRRSASPPPPVLSPPPSSHSSDVEVVDASPPRVAPGRGKARSSGSPSSSHSSDVEVVDAPVPRVASGKRKARLPSSSSSSPSSSDSDSPNPRVRPPPVKNRVYVHIPPAPHVPFVSRRRTPTEPRADRKPTGSGGFHAQAPPTGPRANSHPNPKRKSEGAPLSRMPGDRRVRFSHEGHRREGEVVRVLVPGCAYCARTGRLCTTDRDRSETLPRKTPVNCNACIKAHATCGTWGNFALAWGTEDRATLQNYSFAYWEHVGSGYFAPLVPDAQLADLPALASRINFRQLLYDHLPPVNTERARKRRKTAQGGSSFAPVSTAEAPHSGPSTTRRRTRSSSRAHPSSVPRNPPNVPPVVVISSDSEGETPVPRRKGKQRARHPIQEEGVDELLSESAQDLPAGVRAGDYMADDEDLDPTQLRDVPRPSDPSEAGPSSRPANSSQAGPSSRPNAAPSSSTVPTGSSSGSATASGSVHTGLLSLPDPVFLGFPASQLLASNAFDVDNLAADAQVMVSFFEEHPEANETEYFIYMSALLGIVHKEMKRRKESKK
ncbi:hypothetical protein B0H16DRAFT_1463833 [Mycena metata]|uniref:Uncharacterized protein n=1 Tax=Mycena metata TaxID=1033252 RepID=A0AAD7IK54_9AGAR|nr:hypothetical protein B0H16DRAFT_1463833 [Mycena metata]